MPNVMAAQPNTGGVLCQISVIPFLVPRRKVWLTSAAGLQCSNAANTGERKTWTQSEFCTWQNSVRGQKPPKVYIWRTSPGNSQTLYKVWLASGERRCCSKLVNRSQPLMGRSLSYCEYMWRRYCCLTSFFRLSMHAPFHMAAIITVVLGLQNLCIERK